MTVTIADQIKSVRRELAMRQRVYPAWVAKGKMKQAEADKELAAMQAVHDSLTYLERIEPALEAWRAECGKPQFMTSTSGGDPDPTKRKATVEFTYRGEDALDRSHAMHNAIAKLATAFRPGEQ